MPHENDSTIGNLLSLLIREIRIAKKIHEEWPTLRELEGTYVKIVLHHTRGNKQAASRVLNIDRKTLDRMIKRHNVNLSEARNQV